MSAQGRHILWGALQRICHDRERKRRVRQLSSEALPFIVWLERAKPNIAVTNFHQPTQMFIVAMLSFTLTGDGNRMERHALFYRRGLHKTLGVLVSLKQIQSAGKGSKTCRS